jgi:hypothetical protein
MRTLYAIVLVTTLATKYAIHTQVCAYPVGISQLVKQLDITAIVALTATIATIRVTTMRGVVDITISI